MQKAGGRECRLSDKQSLFGGAFMSPDMSCMLMSEDQLSQQFTCPRISMLITSRENYYISLTQHSILPQFILLQINLPKDKVLKLP